jgi:hypothetical protein
MTTKTTDDGALGAACAIIRGLLGESIPKDRETWESVAREWLGGLARYEQADEEVAR